MTKQYIQSGIYSLTHKTTGKRYINSTRNINAYQKYLIKALEQNTHSNRRLQQEWNRHEGKGFIFETLEVVNDSSELNERKKYWINKYKSNEVEYGYNLELLDRPWEEKRKEWLKQKTWNVKGSIQNTLSKIISKLDYGLEYAEDRKKLVEDLLDDDIQDWFIEYFSSPLFCEKQIKNKTDFLTEDDVSLIGLSIIVDYLVFPRFKNEKDKAKKIERKEYIREKRTTVKMDYRRGNEKLFGEKSEIDSKAMNVIPFSQNADEPNIQRTYTVSTKHVIEDDDLNNYPEINELYNHIQLLKKELGYGLKSKNKEELLEKLIDKYGAKKVSYKKKMLQELLREILEMKELLVGTIRFKQVIRGSTVFNYDEDTGYFNDHGDYVLVSENKIDFSKEKHILELLNHYSQLKQRFYDKPDSDMWAILYDLENLIEKVNFDTYIKELLIMKIDGFQANEIIETIKTKYGIELTEYKVSKIYNELIPKTIVEGYLQEREDWIYTYKVKGVYKTCSKCKEIKLAINKYFSLNKSSKDGYNSICKKCRI